MTAEQLNFYSSWASIISLGVSSVSLVYVRSIKRNIVKFRRKLRVRQLFHDILRIRGDAKPLSAESSAQLLALKRNIPVSAWSRFSQQGRAKIAMHKHIDGQDIVALKEVILDLSSFSEDL